MVFHCLNVYVLQQGATLGLHIQLQNHSFVTISRYRSAFAWWDYSTRDLALPICATNIGSAIRKINFTNQFPSPVPPWVVH